MKTLKSLSIALMGCVLLFSSCDGMGDVHRQYIEGGEIVYRAKAKEVTGFSGKGRAMLTWILEYPSQVVKCEIHSGDKVLASVPVAYGEVVEFEQILEGLSENTYTFSVYSFDKEGNRSIKSDAIVEVFGSRYASTLSTERTIKEVLRNKVQSEQVLIKMSENASSKIVATEVSYRTTAGTEGKVVVSSAESSVMLTDVAADSYFKLCDMWLPNATCIDKFSAPAREYTANTLPLGAVRKFTTIYKIDESTVAVNLTPASGSLLNSIITYDNKEIVVENGTNSLILEGVSSDAKIKLVSVVKVDDKEFLTLSVEQSAEDLLTQLLTAHWTVISYSSQQDSGEGSSGGHAVHAIDDDLSTFWHTQYSPAQPVYPHWMIVDMGEAYTPKAIAVARRNGSPHIAAKIRVEVSNDQETWTAIGEIKPNNSIDSMQMFTLDTPAAGRYFRITGLNSSTSATYMCISEIKLYK